MSTIMIDFNKVSEYNSPDLLERVGKMLKETQNDFYHLTDSAGKHIGTYYVSALNGRCCYNPAIKGKKL